MRIVFFGTPDFAVPSLRALLPGRDPLVGVVCQPDRPAGRGQHVTAPPVKQLAVEHVVPVLQPEKVRTAEFGDGLRAWAPDLIVVAAYGKILPKTILDLPAHGCINVHASLLPKYRGAAPIQWAILRGETTTGVTIMQMNERMDAGDIVLQREMAISADETYGALQSRLAELGATALLEVIDQLRAGTVSRSPQDETLVSLAPMLTKADGRIDWTQPAVAITRQVHAFNPWPSASTSLSGKSLKIHRAHAVMTSTGATPGTIIALADALTVATGDAALVIDELQLEGRKRMLAAEFARGGSVTIGTLLG